MSTPYTPNEETAKTNKILKDVCNTVADALIGIKAQFSKLKVKVIIGAKINKILLELLGIKISFTKSLKPSESG